jgi:membrane protease YdiL (CAAX protease family)
MYMLASYLFTRTVKSMPQLEGLFRDNLILLTAATLAMNVLFLAGGYLVLGVWRKKVTLAEAGVRPLRWQPAWLPLAVGITLMLFPLRAGVGLLVQLLLPESMNSLTLRGNLIAGGEELSLLNFAISMLLVGFLAPISEELYFRGLLHGWMMKGLPRAVRIVGSSLLFGLAHLDSIPVAASAFILGGANAILYERTRSIFAPIAIHMFNNMIGVLLLYLSRLLLSQF